MKQVQPYAEDSEFISRPDHFLNSIYKRHPDWSRCAGVFVTLTAIFLTLPFFDERLLNGISVWSKPFKFSLSFVFYFSTLAWFAPLLPSKYFTTLSGKLLTCTPIICAGFEISYIALQAGLGQTSHFNNTTPIHSMMYDLMGVAAVLLVAVCLWVAVAIARHRRVSDPYILAVVIGLTMTFFLGGILGGYMSSQTSHWVNATASDANGIVFFNWSRDGGDLRVAHFFGIHAMQILPLMAYTLAGIRSRKAWIIVIALSAVYVVFTIGAFTQALAGRSFVG